MSRGRPGPAPPGGRARPAGCQGGPVRLDSAGHAGWSGRGYPERLPEADAWFVAPYALDGGRVPDAAADLMRRFPGALVDFSLDDSLAIDPFPYPGDLRGRIDAWARVAFERDYEPPAFAAGRLALLLPFLPRTVRREYPLLPVSRRAPAVLFVGSLTGDTDPERNTRVRAARLLAQSSVPFVGGVFANVDRPDLAVPADVRCPRYRRYSHLRRLSRVAYGLSLPGNNPLTYRFLECLAMGTLCLSPSLERFRWLAEDIRPGTHYVALAGDLSDLNERLAWYARHPAEADAIAAAGHRAFRDLFRYDGPAYNSGLLERFLAQFPALAGRRRPGPLPRLARGIVNGLGRRLEPLKEWEYAWKERKLESL